MKISSLLLLFALSLSGCEKDSDSLTGLPGTWRLTSQQCYCSPALPDETATFTESEFRFTTAGRPNGSGSYRPATVTPCGTTKAIQVMRFSYSDETKRDYMITVSDQTLVLDDGTQRGCVADADVVRTYARQPK